VQIHVLKESVEPPVVHREILHVELALRLVYLDLASPDNVEVFTCEDNLVLPPLQKEPYTCASGETPFDKLALFQEKLFVCINQLADRDPCSRKASQLPVVGCLDDNAATSDAEVVLVHLGEHSH